ncbi:MAG: hypothetical protein ACRYG4_23045 [Janthinobacterium lividum]
MRRWIVGLLLVAAGPVLAQGAVPASTRPGAPSMLKQEPADKSQPRQKLITVFGADPCPKSDDPDEIIVCSRRPDEERYRIPPAVRTDAKPVEQYDRNRKLLFGDDAGGAGGGIGSCSAVGPGGGTGCEQGVQDRYRAEKKAGQVPSLPQ